MKFVKGTIEDIETYRDFKIVIEHNLNLNENVKEEDYPIYTICGLGRCFQGELKDVRIFIDNMYKHHRQYERYCVISFDFSSIDDNEEDEENILYESDNIDEAMNFYIKDKDSHKGIDGYHTKIVDNETGKYYQNGNWYGEEEV